MCYLDGIFYMLSINIYFDLDHREIVNRKK